MRRVCGRIGLGTVAGLVMSLNVGAETKPDDANSQDLAPRVGTVAVPDDGYDGTLASMACQTVTVNDTGMVDDVDVEVAIEHTWLGDLTVKVVSPAGTVATVQSRAGFAEPADDGSGCCGNSDDLVLASPITYSTTNGNFDAETMGSGVDNNVVCQDDGECSFTPNPDSASDSGDLSSIFDGETASGDWDLCVGDSAGGDAGNLGPVTFSLVTTGVPEITISPDPLDFGDQEVGTTSALQSVTLENTGTADLDVSTVSTPAAPFAAAGGSCGAAPFTLTPGATCTLDYQFSPTTPGAAADTVTIDSNAASSPDSFGLQGNGVQAGLSVTPDPLDFGDQAVGTASATQSVTLENTGTGDLTVTGVSPANPPYADNGDTCGVTPFTLAPGETCTHGYTFAPMVAGPSSDSIVVESNAPSSPDSFGLEGNGVEATVMLDTTNLDLGTVLVGGSSTGTVMVTNGGNADLEITGVTDPGAPFSLDGGDCLPTATVAAGDSCTIDILFDPGQVPGTYNSDFDIVSNAPSSPDTVTVQGVGEAPLLVPSLNRFGLMLLIVLIGGIGFVVMRQR